MLIDFQWANDTNNRIPKNWPKSIGGKYKSDNGFDDRYSIYKSINSIRIGN